MAKNYKPIMPQAKTAHALVGKRVIHRYRQDEYLPEEYRKGYIGTVTGVYEGVNGGIDVLFDNGNSTCLPCSDFALLDNYPNDGSVITSEMKESGWL